MVRILWLAIMLVFFHVHGYTQSPVRSNTSNTNTWLMYFGNHKFSKRVGLHAEVQWRRHDFLSANQQLLLRTGVDFYTPGNNRVTIGYGFIQTYPYGEFAVPNRFPEHRAWQQFLTSQAIGKVTLSHRYRLEQRWIGNAQNSSMEGGRYENRIRYMAKITMPITPEAATPMFLAIYDEVMVNFGGDVAYNVFDQNRLYAALGFVFSPTLKLEVGYLYQLVQLRTLDGAARNRMENNHTVQVGIFSNIPFVRSE